MSHDPNATAILPDPEATVVPLTDPLATMAPASRQRPKSEFAEGELQTIMPRIPAIEPEPAAGDPVDGGIILGEPIGEGGMAVVRSGEQSSLRREVAVKALRPGLERGRAGLLREAYVTGVLEHPNIVTIHDLVFDDQGHPMLVLTRIEGESWYDVMADPSEILAREGCDEIEWNIRIAIKLSRALSFAHTRGFVHRDVKPSNVMIGTFGEVYLLDWGLACSFESGQTTAYAPNDDRAGTPAYMAPEQWDCATGEYGPWTDVYLLAASLWHSLGGAPPWRRISEKGRESRADEVKIPSELRAILLKAMAPAPAERTKSAGALRQELEGYLRQRGSIQLVERAGELAAEANDARSDGDVDRAEYASVEAAVIYRAALTQWPGNSAAIRGELALTRARIDDALERSLPEVASRLLASLANPPADLRERVEKATEIAIEDASKVRALQHDSDRRVGMDMRVLVIMVCGPLWVLGWGLAAWTESTALALGMCVVGSTGWGLSLWALSDTLMPNRLNRMISMLCSICVGALTAIIAVGFVRGDSLTSLAPMQAVVMACSLMSAAVVFEKRLAIFALIWVLILPATLAWPSLGAWLFVAGSVAAAPGIVWVNTRIRRHAEATSQWSNAR